MMEQTIKGIKLQVASVSDRGLNEKRAINEDSFLADASHRIFAVADGVGGAQAGEVASQTAVEVLDEAFRHQKPDDDIEDLLEIAIQRANVSIYQMAQEHTKFARMATTIVVLHINNDRATIGHVGDSRLYRLKPDGQLIRETEDHSVVEDEVRAGRITVEEAAVHPERNVINRALGAEASVEVDLKTINIEDGTIFLLCSDGITRHIPDEEIHEILVNASTPDAACGEMRTRCYRRGAEDNFTAVVIQVGEKIKHVPIEEDEPTISTARASAANEVSASIPTNQTIKTSVPFSKYDEIETQKKKSSITLPVILLILLLSAGAFYGGMVYQQHESQKKQFQAPPPPPPPPAPTQNELTSGLEKRRQEVDTNPGLMAEKLSTEVNGAPLESPDPEFLYLYGRALLLSGRPQEAAEAFRRAVMKINTQPGNQQETLKAEITFATAAVAIKTTDPVVTKNASRQLDEIIKAEPPKPETQNRRR